MDLMANKALVIAVGIFITLALASGVFMVIDNIRLIYSQVYETDTNITSQFDEFDKYDNSYFLGIDLINTYKKYKDNRLVEVYYNDYLMYDGMFNILKENNEFLKVKLKSMVEDDGDIKKIKFEILK